MSTNHRAHENKTAEAADNIPLRLKSLLSCLPGQKRVKSRAKSEKTPLGDIDWTWNGVTRDMCVKHQRIPEGLIAEMDFPCLSQTTSELKPHQRPHMQRTESHTCRTKHAVVCPHGTATANRSLQAAWKMKMCNQEVRDIYGST